MARAAALSYQIVKLDYVIYYYFYAPWPSAPEGTPTFNFLFLIIDLSQSQILLPGRCFACLEISSLPAAQTSFLFLLARVR